jgi:uncharacterized protein
MDVNVAQLMKSSIGAERQYTVDETIHIEGKEVDVKGEIKLVRTDRGLLATGSLDTILEIDCVRCLQPFDCPIKIRFEEEFFPTIDVLTGLPVDLPEEQPGIFTIDEHHIVDFNDAIRQYAILTKPMKPLCQADCPGLCPTCGHNLKMGPCQCPPTEEDSRWAKLKELINKDK